MALQGPEWSWVQHTGTARGADKSPLKPLQCLPIQHHCPGQCFWGRSQAVQILISILTTLAGTRRACAGANGGGGWDGAGRGCSRIPSWPHVRMGFGHSLPMESLGGVIPTLISPAGERHEGQGHNYLKTKSTEDSSSSSSEHSRAAAALIHPPSSQSILKNETLGAAPLKFSLVLILVLVCKDSASSLGLLRRGQRAWDALMPPCTAEE